MNAWYNSLIKNKMSLIILGVILTGCSTLLSAVVAMEVGCDDSSTTLTSPMGNDDWYFDDKPKIAPNNEFLITTSWSNGWRIWDTSDWSLVASNIHKRSIVDISSDSQYVAMGYEGGFVIYHSDDWSILTQQSTNYDFNRPLFSPSNHFLFIESESFEDEGGIPVRNNSNKILSTSDWSVLKEINDSVNGAVFSSNDEYLALCNCSWESNDVWQNSWQILNTTTWSVIYTIYNENERWDTAIFSPKNDYFVCYDEQNLTAYRIDTWEVALEIPASIIDVAFSPDGKYLGIYEVPNTRKLILWDTTTHVEKILQPYEEFGDLKVYGYITFSPTSHYLLWQTYTKTLDILGEEDRIGDSKTVLIDTKDWKTIYTSSDFLISEIFSPDDKYLLLTEDLSFLTYLLYGQQTKVISTNDGTVIRYLNAAFGGIYASSHSIITVNEDYVVCSAISAGTDSHTTVLKVWYNWHSPDFQDLATDYVYLLTIGSFSVFMGLLIVSIWMFIRRKRSSR